MPSETPSAPIPDKTPIELWYGARKHPIQEIGTGATQHPSPGAQGAGMKIAIQGEPGSFSHEAAMNLVADAVIVPFALSADAFAAVANGSVNAAAIPIENSLAGSVSEHFDLLLTHPVVVERETLLRIRHNLIAISGASIGEIDRVFSHPVALAQCRRFLARHPRMESYAFYDTAGSVKQLVELRDRHAAAIASDAAAHFYGAQILEADIEDNPENFTRFFLVRRSGEAVPDPEALLFRRESARFAGLRAIGTLRPGHQPYQDRVAPGARKTVGVRLLCGLPDSHSGRRHARAECASPPLLHGEGTGALPRSLEDAAIAAINPAQRCPS